MSFLEDLFSLSGRVAIVAGASRGLGAAIAEGLARAGASVIAVGRSSVPATGALAASRYQPCDVTEPEAFGSVVADAVLSFGRLDILVNTAGVTLPSASGLQSLQDFDATIAVNLRATYANCVAAAAAMAASGGGSIINVTSIGSALGFPDNPGYVAAKGIRVNNLAPGYIRTEMTEASWADPARHEARRRQTILGRWGEPGDVVGAAVFLASVASAYVTGQDLFVDGGWTAKGLV